MTYNQPKAQKMTKVRFAIVLDNQGRFAVAGFSGDEDRPAPDPDLASVAHELLDPPDRPGPNGREVHTVFFECEVATPEPSWLKPTYFAK